MNMKINLGKLIFAAPLWALATSASADLPNRAGLVALGCEPNGKTATLPSTHPNFRVSPRKRYVFMNRDANGKIVKFCMDEVDTNVTEPTTCRDSVDSGSVKVSPTYSSGFGFESVTVFRKNASMSIKQALSNGGHTQGYSCTPSKEPGAILDYVVNQKRAQRSENAF